jgi:archaeal flagellar protein FlaD
MEDSKIDTNAGSFDIQRELSNLVAKNILPKKLADKLGKKLLERNIKLNRQQLHLLVTKISDILKEYKNVETGKDITPDEKNENMQQLIETVEKLEERITSMEESYKTEDSFDKKHGKNLEVPGEKTARLVQTSDISVDEDIKVPVSQDLEIKPLQKVPNDAESIIVLMKWLQYLIDKCGRDNLSNILDYYVDINWISSDVKISLLDYSHGIKEERTNNTTNKNITDLPSKDHIQSFVYIQKLKGKQFDNRFIDRVDSELNRITKKLDNYSFK